MNGFRRFLSSYNYFSALLLALSISMPDAWLVKVFFMWGVSWLLDALFNRRFAQMTFKKQPVVFYAMLVFYGLMLVSLLYTDNMEYAGKVLMRRISLFAIPMMFFVGFSPCYRIRPLLLAFILGSMLSLCWILIQPIGEALFDVGFRNRLHNNPLNTFVVNVMAFKHRTYYGMIQLISLLVFLYLKDDLLPLMGKKYWFCWWGYLLSILAFMALVGGRMVLITMMLLIFGACVLLIKRRKFLRWGLLSMVAVFILSALLYVYHPRFQKLHPSEFFKEEALNRKDPRVGIWRSCFDLMKEDNSIVWRGVGIGDTRDVLLVKYKKYQMSSEVISHKSHAHNTFLQTLMETGVFGCLIWLSIGIAPIFLVKGKKNRWFTAACQMVFFMLMMVETNSLQIGGFLSYMLCLLCYFYLPNDDVSNTKTTSVFILPKDMPKKCLTTLTLFLCLLLTIVLTYPLYGKKGYDPTDPQTYATRRYTLIETLPGNPPEELNGCKGYQIKASEDGYYNKNLSSCEFSTSFYLTHDDGSTFSVWCYVSEDFDGSQVMAYTASPIAEMRFTALYDLTQKGTWQKLTIDYSSVTMNKEYPFSLFFRKEKDHDLSKLKGYVIFAYPIFE